MNELRIGLRNVTKYFTRYVLLILTISVGFALALALVGLSEGTSTSLRSKSLRYFAGDITITGYVKNGSPKLSAVDQLVKDIHSVYPQLISLGRRTVYYGSDATLKYDGTNFPQRRVIGLDFNTEKSVFDSMDFVEGGLPSGDDKNGIVISNIAANRLKLRVGDQVALFLSTDSGQKNDIQLVVRGIFNEGSIFSYVSYVQRDVLNKTMNRESDSISDLGLIIAQGESTKKIIADLVNTLEGKFQIFESVNTKEQLSKAVGGDFSGTKLAILDLNTHLSQIKNTLDAIFVVTWVVLIVFLTIMTIGLSNTFNMVVRERIKEIATLRAMGMQKSSLLLAYYFESLFVVVGSLAIGAILSITVLNIVTWVRFVPNSITALFLTKGHLGFMLPFDQVFLVIVSILLFSLLGVTRPLSFVTKVSPIKALSQT